MKTGETNQPPNIIYRAPVVFLILFMSSILSVSLFKRAVYCGYKHGDNPVWIRQNTLLLIITVGLLFCISIAIYKLGTRMNHMERRFAAGNILYLSLAVQVLYILLLPGTVCRSEYCQQDSPGFDDGNFSAFQGSYLYQYPNNIGITPNALFYRLSPIHVGAQALKCHILHHNILSDHEDMRSQTRQERRSWASDACRVSCP